MRKSPTRLRNGETSAKNNSTPLLDRYRDRLCTFNDDIQGTGAVTLAGLLAATDVIGSKISRQRVVILGAGSSSQGISDQIHTAMMSEGLSEAEACSRFWQVDSQGLVLSDRPNLEPAKAKYATLREHVAGWRISDVNHIAFADVVRHFHPTVLIGTSAQP